MNLDDQRKRAFAAWTDEIEFQRFAGGTGIFQVQQPDVIIPGSTAVENEGDQSKEK